METDVHTFEMDSDLDAWLFNQIGIPLIAAKKTGNWEMVDGVLTNIEAARDQFLRDQLAQMARQ